MERNKVVQPEGNYFDKYGSTNPVVKRIMKGFHQALDSVLDSIEFETLLDAGCREGHMSEHIHERYPEVGISAFDVSMELVSEVQKRNPEITFRQGSIYEINSPDAYDLVMSLEVLEHMEEPEAALSQLIESTKKYLLVSVPNEPVWRILNFARGKYMKDWGNTPGHINHWNRKAFINLVEDFGEVRKVVNPFPWIMILLEKVEVSSS